MAFSQLAVSTEYITSTVVADHDITGDTIQISFPVTKSAPSEWITATVLGVVPSNGKYTASFRILLGPNGGDTTLTAGIYDVYIKVVDTPEQPVRKIDTITIS